MNKALTSYRNRHFELQKQRQTLPNYGYYSTLKHETQITKLEKLNINISQSRYSLCPVSDFEQR